MKIEKGIKIPVTYDQYSKYPFRDMEVGDSFKLDKDTNLPAIRASATHYGKRNGGKKFSIRKFENGYRCWRVA